MTRSHLLLGHLLSRIAIRDAGHRGQDVDPPESIYSVGNRPAHLIAVRHIAGQGKPLAPLTTDLAERFLCPCRIDIRDQYRRAKDGEGLGDRPPEARPSPRDERNLPCQVEETPQVHVHRFSLRSPLTTDTGSSLHGPKLRATPRLLSYDRMV